MNPLIDGDWHQARALAFSACTPTPTEVIPLAQAQGRSLAAPINASVDLPTDTTSAMDGYAVAGPGPWEIVGEISTSAPHTSELSDGTAVRISTGGVIPVNTLAIIRWEDAQIHGTQLSGTAIKDKDIRPAGLECTRGERIAKAGTVINPGMMGLLAATGVDDLLVHRRPKIALVLTGNELIRQGAPGAGLVRDSIGTMLPSWLEKLGCEVTSIRHINDLRAETVDALLEHMATVDLIITTGGTARGAHDHMHDALAEISAHILIDGVLVRPGHPMFLAKRQKVGILGLPGNPQSAIAALMTLGEPMARALLGQELSQVELLERVPTRTDLRAPDDSTRLILGTLRAGNFEMGSHLGSGMLRGLAFSTGFAVVPPGGAATGELVEWLALP
jgi:molybdopterin molybdotransferase